jgi:hypothetical protein
MMGVPSSSGGNVGMGCQVAVALGEGEAVGWLVGVAEGEATNVAV